MNNDLKPCPFCGSVPTLPNGDGTQYEIECDECGQASSSVQICDLMTIEERAADEFKGYRYGEEFVERAKLSAIESWNRRDAPAAQSVDEAPKAAEKDIERWHDLVTRRPDGPWQFDSFGKQGVNPASDELLAELADWLRMGYTPWNGRSTPLSPRDRQFMYLLYYSVQGLVSRVRHAECAALAAPVQPDWQARCLEVGFKYVREPDDHYVTATPEQMADMLRDVIGVDVRRPNGCGYHEAAPVRAVKLPQRRIERPLGNWTTAETYREAKGFNEALDAVAMLNAQPDQ